MDSNVEVDNYIGAIIKFSSKMHLETLVVDKQDLIQAGFVGMLNGLESFSEEKAKATGTKKTTYVIQCIRNAILQEANKFFGVTALPHNKRLKLNAFKKLLSQNTDRETIKEILMISDNEFDEFKDILHLILPLPLDATSSELAIEDKYDEKIDIQALTKLGIQEEDIKILEMKFSGLTYNEIAEFYNVSRETMRKRIHKTLMKIKNSLKG